MHCKLITLLLFFEVAYPGTAKRVDHNETPSAQTVFREDQTDVAAFNLLNPKQIERAEVTIRHFLTKLVGPIAQPITLRSSPDGNNLQMTMSTICAIIRDKIIQFMQACGLNISPSHERMPWNSTTSKDWFTESLVQGSLLLRDLVRVGEEAWFTIDRYFYTHNISLRGNNDHISTRNIRKSRKFLGVINDASKFNENLFKCLRSMRSEKKKRSSSFDLNQVLASLAAGSPHNSVTSFKSRLDRAFSRSAPNNGTSNKQLYSLLCQSLIEKANQYDDCIEELQCLVNCISSSMQDSNAVIVHRTFPVKPWLAAIEDLSDCRIYVNANSDVNIRCNFERRLPSSTLLQVKYIYEKILGRQIPRQSSLHYIANELGSVLMRSTWARQFVYDVCQYFAIYQDGHAKLRMLSKIAARDQKAAARQRKIFKSLNLYKDGALKKTILAIGNFHRSVLEIQKFFIYGINKIRIWRVINILVDLSLLIYQILKPFGCKESDDTDVDVSILTTIPPTTTDLIDAMTDDNLITTTYRNNKINQIVIYSKKNQMRKERSFDEAFEKLLQSMNHVSNMHRNRNGESTLICLANNLLLTAMFIEAISLVSTLFCLGQKNESTSEEIKKDWLLPERDRRALFLTDFTEIYK